MASRSEKLRRRQRRKEKNGKLARSPLFPLGRALVQAPSGAKMSEMLWALVEPDMDSATDPEQLDKLLTLGVTAWNAAVMKGAKRTTFLDSMAGTFPLEARGQFREIIESLIRRKESQFPHIQRLIFSFNLTWQPSGEPYLQVVSTFEA